MRIENHVIVSPWQKLALRDLPGRPALIRQWIAPDKSLEQVCAFLFAKSCSRQTELALASQTV
jgi:hypothetical protein